MRNDSAAMVSVGFIDDEVGKMLDEAMNRLS
jgi:hypothetical protein